MKSFSHELIKKCGTLSVYQIVTDWDFKDDKSEKNYSVNSQIKAIKIQYSMLFYELLV